MRIRSHLFLLVAAALLPMLVLAVGLTAYSWWQQRNAVELRYLERVRAMTVALDTELDGSVRTLRALSLSPDLDSTDLQAFAARLKRFLGTQPLWASAAVGDREWKQAVAVSRVQPPSTSLDIEPRTREQVLESRQPVVSPLLRTADGRYETQIAVPVLRGDRVASILLVSIEQQAWLRFMSQYPLGPGATMTLLDQDGTIVARTLNNDTWVGRKPAAEFMRRARETSEGAYRSTGLEGQSFYSAHSRSSRSGWTIATGIPAATIEEALHDTSLALAGGAVVTLALAFLLAFHFGRRIEAPVTALGEAAKALASGDPPAVPAARSIDEIHRVAIAFDEAAAMLRERRDALNVALAGEQLARKEAEAASRAKDEFLAMLGHELRNPLNALASAVAVLDRTPPGAPQALRSREILARQIVSLRELVDDLLDVARVTRGRITLNRKPMDLCHVVKRTVGAMADSGRLARHHLELHCDEAWILGDETRIEQIVNNLLDNAAKFTPPEGRISVRVYAKGDDAVLEVEDTGKGIAPELLPRVFELFTQGELTLDRSQGGLGLGLTLVRRLVELHGGEVTAASSDGGGSRFTVRIPRAARPAESAQPGAVAGASTRPLRVLVVEDNADGRDTLVMMLGIHGHEVEGADSGPAGLARALELVPDAAIVDIGLPGFDGYELARRLRASPATAKVKLIAMTGYGQAEDRRLAIEAGFDAFLVKPADLDALGAILATV